MWKAIRGILFATLRLRGRPGRDGWQSVLWDCFGRRIFNMAANSFPKTVPQCTISIRSPAQSQSGEWMAMAQNWTSRSHDVITHIGRVYWQKTFPDSEVPIKILFKIDLPLSAESYFEVARKTGSRWLSKCIVELFWATHFQHGDGTELDESFTRRDHTHRTSYRSGWPGGFGTLILIFTSEYLPPSLFAFRHRCYSFTPATVQSYPHFDSDVNQ